MATWHLVWFQAHPVPVQLQCAYIEGAARPDPAWAPNRRGLFSELLFIAPTATNEWGAFILYTNRKHDCFPFHYFQINLTALTLHQVLLAFAPTLARLSDIPTLRAEGFLSPYGKPRGGPPLIPPHMEVRISHPFCNILPDLDTSAMPYLLAAIHRLPAVPQLTLQPQCDRVTERKGWGRGGG